MKEGKLSFFDWCSEQERTDEDPVGSWKSFYENYCKNTGWSDGIHVGDCTKFPCSCLLCSIEDLLREYRHYYLDIKSDMEVFYPEKRDWVINEKSLNEMTLAEKVAKIARLADRDNCKCQYNSDSKDDCVEPCITKQALGACNEIGEILNRILKNEEKNIN